MLNAADYNNLISKFASEEIEDYDDGGYDEDYETVSDAMDEALDAMNEASDVYDAADAMQTEAEEDYSSAQELADDAMVRANACDVALGDVDEAYLDPNYLYSNAADEEFVGFVEKTAAVYESAQNDYAMASNIAETAQYNFDMAAQYKEAAEAQYNEAYEVLAEAEEYANEMEKSAGIKGAIGGVKNAIGGARNAVKTFADNHANAAKDDFALADILHGVKEKGAFSSRVSGIKNTVLAHPYAAGGTALGIAGAAAGTAAYMHHQKKKREAEKNAFDIIEEAYQEKIAAYEKTNPLNPRDAYQAEYRRKVHDLKSKRKAEGMSHEDYIQGKNNARNDVFKQVSDDRTLATNARAIRKQQGGRLTADQTEALRRFHQSQLKSGLNPVNTFTRVPAVLRNTGRFFKHPIANGVIQNGIVG